MAKAQQINYPRGLDFEQVWAALMENREQMRKNDERLTKQLAETERIIAETERQMKENDERLTKQRAETERIITETERQMKENDERLAKRMAESHERLEKQMRATDKKISDLGSRFGEAIEYMVKPNLINKFNELGFAFTKIYPETEVKDKINNIFLEIDLTLEDGDTIMIVEVKSKPSIQDIKKHSARMEKVRLHADLHNDRRKYLGAVAGMVVNDNAREFALKNGFYVIEPSGDTFTISEPKGKYKVREWAYRHVQGN